jgi:hypothetical protein
MGEAARGTALQRHSNRYTGLCAKEMLSDQVRGGPKGLFRTGIRLRHGDALGFGPARGQP